MSRKIMVVITSTLVILMLQPTITSASVGDPELKAKAGRSIDRGLKWLRTQQQDNGSWEQYPGITALVLTAYARSPRAYTEEDGPFIRKAVAYLTGLAKPDGSIYSHDLPVYNTSVAVLALCAVGNPEYAPTLMKAREYLVKAQIDEGEDYETSDKFYGGIGYGNDERPDLSNLHLALESLKATNLPEDDPVWDRAISFLQRCQNRSESNDQSWAGNDGGFVYYPGTSMAEGTRSYGSMSYAGLKSFLYANLDKDDPRVIAAYDWIRKHYSTDENPGMGAQGLYYYFHTFAKALRVFAETDIVDADGNKHVWADELVREILDRQHDEGYWVNSGSGRWWEGNKVLATSLAILAMEEAMDDPGPAKNPCPALEQDSINMEKASGQ